MIKRKYFSFQINEPDAGRQDMLVAMLQDYGFDGFEQTDSLLIANGFENAIDDAGAEQYLTSNGISFSKTLLDEENWNKMWESDFEPIIIDNYCAVRASFHEPVENVEYDIVITPKMSFGTGHHATTWMMLKAMEQVVFEGKTVIDFGTGTGVLAILAEKKGARFIHAIDYDDWCIENGNENVAANNCHHIQLSKADNLSGAERSDIILANINKNIIMDHFAAFKPLLQKEGILLLSGILKEDETDIMEKAIGFGLQMNQRLEKNGWLCICFKNAA